MERPRTKKQTAGTVIGLWSGTSHALIQLETGAVVEAIGAVHLRNAFKVGAAALVYFNGNDEVVGWMLADDNTGVNLERGLPA